MLLECTSGTQESQRQEEIIAIRLNPLCLPCLPLNIEAFFQELFGLYLSGNGHGLYKGYCGASRVGSAK
jgi:hypothetical protein